MIIYEIKFNYAGYISVTEKELIDAIKASFAYSDEQAREYLDTLEPTDIKEFISNFKDEPTEIEFIDTEFITKWGVTR